MQVYIKIFILLLLTACLREKQDGFIFDEDALSQVKIGKTTNEIVAILGTPSFKLGDDILVYSSVTKEFRAFFRPKVKSQLVMELEFKNGKLARMVRHDEVKEFEYDKIQTKLDTVKKPKKD